MQITKHQENKFPHSSQLVAGETATGCSCLPCRGWEQARCRGQVLFLSMFLQGTSTCFINLLAGDKYCANSFVETKMKIPDNFLTTFFKPGLVVCTSGACLAGLTAPQYRSFQFISLNLKMILEGIR